jgi:MFS family permease
VIGTLAVIVAGLLLSRLLLGLIGATVLVVGATTFAAYEADHSATPPGSRVRTAGNAMAGASLVGIALGLSTVLSPAVLGLALLLAVTSPRAIRWCCVTLASSSSVGDPGPIDRETGELCREWQHSYEALRQATTPTAQLRVVMARQRCLDELERRDPEGIHAWLSSTASAAGDPTRFLGGPK